MIGFCKGVHVPDLLGRNISKIFLERVLNFLALNSRLVTSPHRVRNDLLGAYYILKFFRRSRRRLVFGGGRGIITLSVYHQTSRDTYATKICLDGPLRGLVPLETKGYELVVLEDENEHKYQLTFKGYFRELDFLLFKDFGYCVSTYGNISFEFGTESTYSCITWVHA